MIEAEIVQQVSAHYKAPDAGILLLSKLGTLLSAQNAWPVQEDRRTLWEVVEATQGVKLVRDEEGTRSFIAVVLEGDEPRALSAIANRRRVHLLRGLPFPLLLAFTLRLPDGHVMAMVLRPRVRYTTSVALQEGAVLVDDDLRLPGVDVSDLDGLSTTIIEELEANIRAWSSRHGIDLTSLTRSPGRAKPEAAAVAPGVAPSRSALERLYNAQEADVARRLSVPIDIALVLSRIA